MANREQIKSNTCWVVKIGSAMLTASGKGLDKKAIANWVADIAELRKSGVNVVLVSSGAVAEGMLRLGWAERPEELHDQQAAAAVGQTGLVRDWDACFQQYNIQTAQVLLTHNDLAVRNRCENAKNTFQALLKYNAIPIVNENDTVATEEIRFGDNDTLAALVANLVEADLLVILTDQKGMYDCDPRQNKEAKLISDIVNDDPVLDGVAKKTGGALGRGGMYTKLMAARLAAQSGTNTLIAHGAEQNVLQRVFQGEKLGTFLMAPNKPKILS
jgi:glutamate 5-kinase